MALINCPNCGNPIPDRAAQCPRCGFVLNPTTYPQGTPCNQSFMGDPGRVVGNKPVSAGLSKGLLYIGNIILLINIIFCLSKLFIFKSDSLVFDASFAFISILALLSTPLILFGLLRFGPKSNLKILVGVGVGIIFALRFGSRIVALLLLLLSLPDTGIQTELIDLSEICYRFFVSDILSIFCCVVYGAAAIVIAVNLRKSIMVFPTVLLALLCILDLAAIVGRSHIDTEILYNYYCYIFPVLSGVMAIAYLCLANPALKKLRSAS